MSRVGLVVAEAGHVVNLIPPVDITGGKVSQAFSMKNYAHATIILQIGVSAAAFTKIFVDSATATAAVGTPAAGAAHMNFSIYTQETAGADKDVLSARTAVVAATGYTPAATDGIFYVIEIDGSELPDGSPWVQLNLTNGANSVIASAVAILSGARYAETQSPTVTA
jgi:hypothetical protein